MTDLPFGEPLTPANPAAPKPRVCRRHEWGMGYFDVVYQADDEGFVSLPDGRLIAVGFGKSLVVPVPQPGVFACARCHKVRDDVATRRGRTNRSRGNSIEREVGKVLGLRRVGQYGGPDDLAGEMFAAQVKSGGAFSERFWSWLKAVPTNAGQTPILVVGDAPGPGRKRRAVVILDLTDWVGLHGPTADVS